MLGQHDSTSYPQLNFHCLQFTVFNCSLFVHLLDGFRIVNIFLFLIIFLSPIQTVSSIASLLMSKKCISGEESISTDFMEKIFEIAFLHNSMMKYGIFRSYLQFSSLYLIFYINLRMLKRLGLT